MDDSNDEEGNGNDDEDALAAEADERVTRRVRAAGIS